MAEPSAGVESGEAGPGTSLGPNPLVFREGMSPHPVTACPGAPTPNALPGASSSDPQNLIGELQHEEGWDGSWEGTSFFAKLPLRQRRCLLHSPRSTIN